MSLVSAADGHGKVDIDMMIDGNAAITLLEKQTWKKFQALNGIRTHDQSKGRGFESRSKPEIFFKSVFQGCGMAAAFASIIMSTFHAFN